MRLSSANANFAYKMLSSDPWLPAGGFVQINAYAKINLFLDVLGKRPDGYHDIASVMQNLCLCDELTFHTSDGEGVLLELESCDIPQDVPLDESNLIIKAAKRLAREYKINKKIIVRLRKRIPMGAGLGGGSSDCAATLHGLNKLFALNIPLHKLMEIGRELGADVPFCLHGGTVLAHGIGEKLTPLPPHPPCHVVLACPDIHVSTAEVFKILNSSANFSAQQAFLKAYATGDVSPISRAFYNVFTPVTSKMHPEIAELIAAFKKLGALGSSMTGTGSAVFAYFENENGAINARDNIGVRAVLTRPLTQMPIVE